MALPQPLLNLFGPLPPPGLETGLQFAEHRSVNLGWLAAAMITLQQPRHSTRLERINPVEELSSADTDLFGNLRRRKLAAGRQPHGQQAPVGRNVFDRSQGAGHRDGQLRSLQMKSLGHDLLLPCSQNSAITN